MIAVVVSRVKIHHRLFSKTMSIVLIKFLTFYCLSEYFVLLKSDCLQLWLTIVSHRNVCYQWRDIISSSAFSIADGHSLPFYCFITHSLIHIYQPFFKTRRPLILPAPPVCFLASPCRFVCVLPSPHLVYSLVERWRAHDELQVTQITFPLIPIGEPSDLISSYVTDDMYGLDLDALPDISTVTTTDIHTLSDWMPAAMVMPRRPSSSLVDVGGQAVLLCFKLICCLTLKHLPRSALFAWYSTV